jgi:glutaredoxin-like protein NrdH
MTPVQVPGRKSGQVMLYALSTCGWCHRTKRLLDDLGVEYSYEYVDQLDGEQREAAVKEVKQWNPSCSFPTLVLDNKKCIIGYNEREIKETLQK